MKQVLMIFAKHPDVGSVKTRLLTDLTPAEAADLYEAMTEDMVSLHAADPLHDTIICFTPAESRDNFKSWLGEEIQFMPQEGDDLGARQLNAFRGALDLGYKRVIIIGTDCPCVTRADIEDAFRRLEACDVVLGPSKDGGYYLVGARRAHSILFKNIEWGGPHVLHDTLKQAERAGITVGLVSRRFDVDRFDDVEMLYSVLNLQADRGWSGPVVAKATFKVLDSIFGEGE
ncbi:MAG: TIGR04282 family arsenosugar biosynthesis glycosyltransferase [Candidatus Eisenbacteria bacterium]